MRYSRVAFRYAEALFKEAKLQGKLDEAHQSVHRIREGLQGSSELRAFLKSPIIKGEQKISALEAIFGAVLTPSVANFLKLLAHKMRMNELEGITYAFEKIYNEEKDIVEVIVTSAIDLEESQKQEILKKAGSIAGGMTVQARFAIDTSLIGGFTIRLGDTVYDYSIHNQLLTLQKHLAGGIRSN